MCVSVSVMEGGGICGIGNVELGWTDGCNTLYKGKDNDKRSTWIAYLLSSDG